MSEKKKKRFFAAHAKSSAAVISIGIHALLIVAALSFVAVKVITKEEQVFEAKPVNRPKMQLKKLQVPVNVKKKKTKKPKLRKRIVVKPKLNQAVPDIKMPEISGVKGGIGAGAGGGLGGGGGLGFTMPEINVFGVKGTGEKIFIILDSTSNMMVDKMGGIPSYTLIKDELVKILGNLSSTVLFNIAVYDVGPSLTLFPQMVPASDANVAKVKTWLDPLNAVSKGMGDKDYGVKTLGDVPGAERIRGDYKIGALQTHREWVAPIITSMQQQADVVFLLSHGWGTLWYDKETIKWSEDSKARWEQAKVDGKKKLAKENDQRREKGQAPRVFKDDRSMVKTYFPGVELPPVPERHTYTAKEMTQAMDIAREKSKKTKNALTSRLSKTKNKKSKYSINVIHFVSKGGAREKDEGRFKDLVRQCNGDYRTLSGFDEIKGAKGSD